MVARPFEHEALQHHGLRHEQADQCDELASRHLCDTAEHKKVVGTLRNFFLARDKVVCRSRGLGVICVGTSSGDTPLAAVNYPSRNLIETL